MTFKQVQVNEVLAERNPIEVPENVAFLEYQAYIPKIIESIGNEESILQCLMEVLRDTVQIEYDPSDESRQ